MKKRSVDIDSFVVENAKQYPDVDFRTLEPLYSMHVDAMTEERLIRKADIAAQLALRDRRIESLQRSFEMIKADWIRVSDLYSATLARDFALGRKTTP